MIRYLGITLLGLSAGILGCGRPAQPPARAAGVPPAPPAPPRVELPVPPGTVLIATPQPFFPSMISISADGQYLFANDATGAAYLWKIAGDQATQVDNVARRPNAPPSQRMQRGVLSQDGSRLAVMFPREIVIVRTPDIQQEVCSIQREGGSSFLSFTPDAQRLLSLEDGGWKLFDANSGAKLADNYPLGVSFMTHCGFDATGASALVAGAGGFNAVELATGKTSELLSFRQPAENYLGAGVSDDGSWVVATAADRVDIWDARTKAKTATWPMTSKHHSPLITSDGRFVILEDKTQLFVWDVAAKQQVATWDVQGLDLGMPLLADKAGRVAAYARFGPQIRVFSLPK
jgi:hypothetical protein